MIKEICSKLKEKRKESGYDIEYVVEKTKLYPSVIKDIEECNLTNMSATYLKGFIKIYAAFLGVELGNVLDEIDSITPKRKIPVKSLKRESSNFMLAVFQRVKKIPPEVRRKAITIALICILFIGFVNFTRFLIKNIVTKIKSMKQASVEEKVPVKTEIIPKNLDEIEVSLTAKKKCFLRVTVDGKLLFEGILQKGAVESWQGDKEIEFKISDGSAVYIEVNGKPLPKITSIRTQIKSLKITPSGISVDK